jgi:antitoxin (DNA-binding transcriptional repressor) of toxin-antitoxin stability system
MHPPACFLQLRGRAKVVVALLIATALVSVLSILYELDMRSLLDRVAAGQPIGLAEAQAADDRVALAATLSLAALVATSVAFIAWFFRAYVNIERLGARELRATKGWSIGVWFIPFLNLIRPKQLMDDIWRASDPALPAGEVRDWQHAGVPVLLHGWWAIFLLAGVVSNIAGRMLTNAETLPERANAGEISMIGDGGIIVAAILAVLVVRAVTSRQETRAARLRPGSPTASATQYPAPQPIDAERPNSFPPPTAAQ